MGTSQLQSTATTSMPMFQSHTDTSTSWELRRPSLPTSQMLSREAQLPQLQFMRRRHTLQRSTSNARDSQRLPTALRCSDADTREVSDTDGDRSTDLPSTRDQLELLLRETHTHMSQPDTRPRETTTGREPSMTSHLTSPDQSEDTTGPSTTSSTPRTESLMLTEERDTPSSTSAREKDAQTARIRPAPSFKTFSTELERTTARIATLITLPAKDTTEKI